MTDNFVPICIKCIKKSIEANVNVSVSETKITNPYGKIGLFSRCDYCKPTLLSRMQSKEKTGIMCNTCFKTGVNDRLPKIFSRVRDKQLGILSDFEISFHSMVNNYALFIIDNNKYIKKHRFYFIINSSDDHSYVSLMDYGEITQFATNSEYICNEDPICGYCSNNYLDTVPMSNIIHGIFNYLNR